MKLSEPIRWLIFFGEWAIFAMIIPWGFDQAKPADFRKDHYYELPVIVLIVVVCSVSVWSVYRLFPSVIHTYETAGHIVATAAFVAGFLTVMAIADGTNALDSSPKKVSGVLIRYVAVRRASNASLQGHYGRVRLTDGTEILVERVSLDKRAIYMGAELQLIIHRGRFYDWGEIDDKK